ncbi:MAG TPA: Na(+)/H(+) antiporter subunit D, partial [Bacillota bacterium]
PFVLVFTLTLIIGGLYAYHLRDRVERGAALLYGGAAIFTVLAGDWLTFYAGWEIMGWSSLYLIWAARDEASARAGQRYLLVHLFSGSLLLAGIWVQLLETGSLLITPLAASQPGSWPILLAFAINAAVPPLHPWLPDAYPRATVTGSVFLSAFTTKTAVYALARVFAGWDMLIWVGIVMAVYGVVYALIANEMRQLLAYHIVSQVGFMVAAIGLGGELATSGAVAHAFAHVLYKGLLFMAAGAVVYAVGTGKLTELGGWAGPLRWVLVCYLVGAVSISGVPPFSGFVSKSLVTAAFDASLPAAALALKWASIGTFLSTTLKLPYFVWFAAQTPHQLPRRKVPVTMYAAMALAGLLSLLIGLFPSAFYRLLPYAVAFRPYTAGHLLETAQLLLLAVIPFVLWMGRLAPKPGLLLDTDWFYRRLTPWLFRHVAVPISDAVAAMDRAVDRALGRLVAWADNPSLEHRRISVLTGAGAVLLAFALLMVWAFAAMT